MENIVYALMESLDINENEFKVINNNFYKRLENGEDLSLIFGEGYMNNEWVSNDLASFFRKVLPINNFNELLISLIQKHHLESMKLIFNMTKNEIFTQMKDIFENNQSISLSKRVGAEHYDIPNILYNYMLDTQKQYTCGYWKDDVLDLETAQHEKINLILNKLQIPDDVEFNILDIGCGWGGLTNAISKRYPKCNIEGISISQEQINDANRKYSKNDKLKYLFCDYRDLPKKNKKYDRIVSVGMFEHVGIKNYDTYFDVCQQILKDDGIFVLHTITQPTASKYIHGLERYTTDKWIDTYIFPGGYIPTMEQVLTSFQSKNMMCHHSQNLSISYAKTLEAWYNNFSKNWEIIKKSNPAFFTDKFYKMWEFYLLSCMVSFEIKKNQLTQFVITKKNYLNMYVFTEK